MAKKRWIAAAHDVPQIDTYTVTGTWATSTDTATATCNNKAVTVTIGAATGTDDVAAALAAAIMSDNKDSDLLGTETKDHGGYEYGEYRQVTAKAVGSVLTIQSVRQIDGSYAPFTIVLTESAVGGGSLGSKTATQAQSGKHNFDNAANWEGGLPSDDDTIQFDHGSTAVRYGLNDSSSITGLSMTRSNFYTGDIGLEPINTDTPTHPFPEYQTQHLNLPNTVTTGLQAIEIGGATENTVPPQGKTYLDLGTTLGGSLSVAAYSTAPDHPVTGEKVKIIGGKQIYAYPFGGRMKLGGTAADNAPEIIGVVTRGAGSHVNVTSVCTMHASLESIEMHGGAMVFAPTGVAAQPTFVIDEGECLCDTVTTLTTVTLRGGSFTSNDSIATLVVGSGATYTAIRGASITVTNSTVYNGFTINDTDGDVTWTNPTLFSGCNPNDGRLNLRDGLSITLQ